MTKTSKTLLFFGNERLVSGLKSTDTPVLKGLIKSGYTIKAIVSHHTDSLSRNNRPLEVAQVATEHNIPLFLPNRPKDIKDELKALNADAAILVAYGRIIPQSIIDLFPLGIINIHPSLLPKYRGPTPIESVILNGDSETGVSIMQLTAGMDEGPVFAQTTVPLDGKEDKFELYTRLARQSADLLLETLPSILDGTLKATPQDNSHATYCHLLSKSDSILDPTQHTAINAERRIRAHLNFPKTKMVINKNLTIVATKAHTSHDKKTPLDIQCRDGFYLSVDELIAPNGKTMAADAFIRGYLSR